MPLAVLDLPDDALSAILRHSPLPALCRFRSTCHLADRLVATELEHRYRTLLSGTIHDHAAFRTELRYTGAVISGSGAMLLVGQTVFRASDLDVYVPRANFFHLIGYLLHIEHYQTESLRSPLNDLRGMAGVVRLARNGTSIDIVQSLSDCATLPIINFWSTAVMNSLSGSSICVPYPLLLENGRALLNPAREDVASDPNSEHPFIVKYRALGFEFRKTELEWKDNMENAPRCAQDNSPTCPITTRWMTDKFCLNVHLGAIGERMRASLEPIGDWTTVWWRGGELCENTCDKGRKHTKPGVFAQLRDAVM